MKRSAPQWATTRFGDIVTHSAFGPRFSGEDYAEDGNVATLRTTDLDDHGRISYDTMPLARLNEDHFASHILSPGDLLITRSGTCGIAAVFEGFSLPVLAGAFLIRFRLSDRADPRYFRYYFNSPYGRQHILSVARGAVQQNLNITNIEALTVPLPSRDEQDRIVTTVSAYDDLIENNRRRMALLEESARLLYQEWFVRLRFPGHEHVRTVDGIPAGWTQKPLRDVAEFRLGKMLDQKKNRGDLMPYLANLNVRWGEFDFQNLREMRFEHDELKTFGLKYGDIVMCEGGEPGRCAIWKEQMPGMMIQKAIHRIRVLENMNYMYLYYCLRHQGQSGQLATLFTGATIKHLPREKLERVRILVPPSRLINQFVELAEPVENQLKLLELANRRASEARDLLLPRLMSGETKV